MYSPCVIKRYVIFVSQLFAENKGCLIPDSWYHLDNITLNQFKLFNQRSKFTDVFYVHLNIHNIPGHSRCLFNPCRAFSPWINESSLGPHMLNGYGSMTFSPNEYIRGPAFVRICSTSHPIMRHQSSLHRGPFTGGSEKKRQRECSREWIRELVLLNLTLVSIMKRNT